MGILNVTPDSFSEHGLYADPARAIEGGLRMVDEGADIIDVGGESSRPGAMEVSLEEELGRVVPVVEALSASGTTVSIDTRKPLVAKRALALGAKIVNDISGLRNPEMVQVCVEAGCTVCIMHMRGSPETMQSAPDYQDVVSEVKAYLLERARDAEKNGIGPEKIWIDPGIGFGKTAQHNLQLIDRLEEFVATGYPVLIGMSRKSFLGTIGSRGTALPPEERLVPTLAAQTVAQLKGARILRAHDVAEARKAIDTVAAILNSG